MEWPLEDLVTVPARWQNLEGLGKVFQKAVYVLNQHPIYGVLSLVAKIIGVQEFKSGIAHYYPQSPLAKFLSPQLYVLLNACLDILVSEGGMFTPGDTIMILLKKKLGLLHGHFGLLIPLNQKAMKVMSVLVGVITLDWQGEIGILLYNESKEEYSRSLTAFLSVTISVIKVNRKLQQLKSGSATNGPDPSGRKV